MDIRNIQLEHKSSIIFASAALLLSLLTGIISGIDSTTVVIRALVSAVSFAGLGFAVIFILKKFVPEFAELFKGRVPGDEDSIDVGVEGSPDRDADEYGGRSDEQIDEKYAAAGGSDGFSEFGEDAFPRVQSAPAGGGLDDSLNTPGGGDEYVGGKVNPSKGKMGKHIIANESMFKYEPKIMAEAVRTMMRKGEE